MIQKYSFEIIIPIFNEGAQVIKLLELFDHNIKNKCRVLLCYDNNDDDIFK